MKQEAIVRVAINVPISHLFDYLAGDHEIKPGCRVRVPFGSQSLVGVVLDISDKSDLPTKKLKLYQRFLTQFHYIQQQTFGFYVLSAIITITPSVK